MNPQTMNPQNMNQQNMNPQKKSWGWALLLVVLGWLALYAGPRGLALLVPAAILVWYRVAESAPRNRRN
jgi:hypothetical protein